jgi:hypothetical protein
MIRTTNGPMRGQKEARSPIVDSCSSRAVGSRPCPRVLSDPCRNCSVRLLPPYSVRPKLRHCAQKPHGSSSVPARIDQSKFLQMTRIIAQRSVSRMGIDLNADSGKLAFPPTIDGLRNLALRLIKVMCDAKFRRLSGTPAPTAAPRHGSTVSYTNLRVARKYAYNEYGGANADCNAGRRAGRLDSAENAR